MSLVSVMKFAFALLPVLSLAAPANLDSQAGTIDEGLLSQIRLFEQYAAASYCPENYKASRGRRIFCPTGNCPLAQNALTTITQSFSESPGTDTNGFVSLDQTNKLIVVAFRGVESWQNVINLLNLFPETVDDLCDGCKVVRGLYNFWKDVRDPVEREVRRLQYQLPNYRTVVVGHSLGGAIATYAAAELRRHCIRTDLVTFGAPRVGNPEYVRNLQLQTPSYGFNFRFVHVGDPVPSIPPSWMNYAHPGPEYVISSETTQPVTARDVTIRSYSESDQDGDITPWLLENTIKDSWEAHTWYFNAITICFNGGALSGLNNPFKNNPDTNPSLQTPEDLAAQSENGQGDGLEEVSADDLEVISGISAPGVQGPSYAPPSYAPRPPAYAPPVYSPPVVQGPSYNDVQVVNAPPGVQGSLEEEIPTISAPEGAQIIAGPGVQLIPGDGVQIVPGNGVQLAPPGNGVEVESGEGYEQIDIQDTNEMTQVGAFERLFSMPVSS